MTTVIKRRRARLPHRCEADLPHDADRRIDIGNIYLELVLMPDADVGNTMPWRMRICADCAYRQGRGELLEPLPPDSGQQFRYWLGDEVRPA